MLLTISAVSFPEAATSITRPESHLGEKGQLLFYMRTYAEEYDVDYDTMYALVACETAHTFDATIQSRHTYPYTVDKWNVRAGDRELSFGAAQIHLPSHPGVTQEQATDPDFSMQFLARNIAEGRIHMWSCAKMI